MTDLIDQIRSAADDLFIINQNISNNTNNSSSHASSQCPENRPRPDAKLIISFDTDHIEASSQCPENSSSSSSSSSSASVEAKLGISFETRSDIQLMEVDSLEDVFQTKNSQSDDDNNNVQNRHQHQSKFTSSDPKVSEKYLEWQETLDLMTSSPKGRRTNPTNQDDDSDLSSMDSSDEFDETGGGSRKNLKEMGLETLEEPDYHFDSECENSSSAENGGSAATFVHEEKEEKLLTIVEYPKDSPAVEEEDFTIIDDDDNFQENYLVDEEEKVTKTKIKNDSNIKINEIVDDFFDEDDSVTTLSELDNNKSVVAEEEGSRKTSDSNVCQDFSNNNNHNHLNWGVVPPPPPSQTSAVMDNYVIINPHPPADDDKRKVMREPSDSTMSDSENSVAVKEFLNTVHCTPKLRLMSSELDPNKNKLVIMEPLETIDEENLDDMNISDSGQQEEQQQHEPTFLERLENIFFWRKRKEEEVEEEELYEENKLQQNSDKPQSVTVAEHLFLDMDMDMDDDDEFALKSHEPSASTPVLHSTQSNKSAFNQNSLNSNSDLNLSNLEFSDDDDDDADKNIFDHSSHNDNIFMDSDSEEKIVQEVMGDGSGSTTGAGAGIIINDNEISKNFPVESIQQEEEDDDDEFSECWVLSGNNETVPPMKNDSSQASLLISQNDAHHDDDLVSSTLDKENDDDLHKIIKEETVSSTSSSSLEDEMEDTFSDALNELPTIKSANNVQDFEEKKEENGGGGGADEGQKPPFKNTEESSLITMLDCVSKKEQVGGDCKFVMQVEAENSGVIANILESFGKLEENLSGESEMTKLQEALRQIQIINVNQNNNNYLENEKQYQQQQQQSLQEFEPDLAAVEVRIDIIRNPDVNDDDVDGCPSKIVCQSTIQTKEIRTDDDKTTILPPQQDYAKENNDIMTKTLEEGQVETGQNVLFSGSLPMDKEEEDADDGGGGEDLEQMEEPVPIPAEKGKEMSPDASLAENKEKEISPVLAKADPPLPASPPVTAEEEGEDYETTMGDSRWNRMDGYVDVLYVKMMSPPSLKSSSSSILKSRHNNNNYKQRNFDSDEHRTKGQEEKIIRFPLHQDDAQSVMVLAVNSHLPQLHARYLDTPKQINFKIPRVLLHHDHQDSKQFVGSLKLRCPLAIPVSFKLSSVLQLDMTPDMGVVFPQEVIRVQVHCQHHTHCEDEREWLDQLKIEGILVYAAPFIFNRGYAAVGENLTSKDIQEFWNKLTGPRFRYTQTRFIPIQVDDQWIPIIHESKENGGLMNSFWRALNYLNIFKCPPPPTSRLTTLSPTDLMDSQASPIAQVILRRHINIYRMLQSRVERLNDHRTVLIASTIICAVGAILFYFFVYRPELMRIISQQEELAKSFWEHCTAIWSRLLQKS